MSGCLEMEDFFAMLDEKGYDLIPDEWLEKRHPKTDPFWVSFCKIYDSTYSKLKTLVDARYSWKDIPYVNQDND